MGKHTLSLFFLGLFLLPPTLSAQEKPIEIGFDMGLSIVMPDHEEEENQTLFGLPSPNTTWPTGIVRFGFFVTPQISLEPLVSFTRMSDDNSTITALQVFPNVVYHFKPAGRETLPYVRVGGGFNRVSYGYDEQDYSESESDSQFGIGGGAGVKIPFAETAFLRLEGGYDKWFEGDGEESDLSGAGVIKFMVGITAVIN